MRTFLGKNARRVAEQEYNLSLQVQRYQNLYHQLLQDPRKPVYNKVLTNI
ncbi:MAG: hypothetical protein HC880_02100 [Bacteroidia bacterium]|nr:hypothetical protein [Bacteroidia bacterium]